MLTGDAPHGGEVHPDGDEVLYMVSGVITVRLELADGDRTIDLGTGEALAIPKGIWHRIKLREPGRLIHITLDRTAITGRAKQPRRHDGDRGADTLSAERRWGGATMTDTASIAGRRPVVLGPGEGRAYPMGRVSAVFKADGVETGEGYSISEWWLARTRRGLARTPITRTTCSTCLPAP